ncbi:molybdate ABC transporter substrate-binding protein [Actinotalea sp. M2MS4P-6]|uniref:molybdate ABC transporter substrate-binding protein n=1 Tax=Actinotalea sp. M2MS4P-6 TaxID=2983762 RepID=UPI0021E3841C|nr:molybdate ABC transporter substrate-binding protein [Actinotalea sp. M2MS4P-6]MCV2393857.1 molybdate ABC transporter substrate-binding protein [Actinotalea sp. M2MS4P-6]
MAVGVALGALVLGITACSGPDGHERSEDGGELTVLAAASLTDVFAEIGDAFEAANPGVTVSFSFAGSAVLAQQVIAGAPADVLATASTATMDTAAAMTGPPEVFTTNTLEIAVPAGNPGGVTGLADLADPGLTVALCAEEVPCGAAAAAVLAGAGVTAAPDTYEQDVRAVLTKVILGEVDAGLVYRTDVASAGDDVEGIDVAGADVVRNDYWISVVTGTDEPDLARAFVEYVLAEPGQAVLAAAGFGSPESAGVDG